MIVCYPQPGKRKALLICEAFAAGVKATGGRAEVCANIPDTLLDGDAFFYGVRSMHAHLWEQAKAEGRDWYYADNSYHDCVREQQFRVTRNAIQHTGEGDSDGKRFKALGITVKPMREDGKHVVLCEQSAEFMTVVAHDPDFYQRVAANLRRTGREVLVRRKGEARPLADDLSRAVLLVTWSSAAAVEALLAGVRVMCDPQCCATYAGEDRGRWASVLADHQYTLDELASGLPWQK